MAIHYAVGHLFAKQLNLSPAPWAATCNQPLHQPSLLAAILWFMMESKQMPEHPSIVQDLKEGMGVGRMMSLFMQIASGVFRLAIMDKWTCEFLGVYNPFL